MNPDDDNFVPARGEPNTAVESDGLVFIFGPDGILALVMSPEDYAAFVAMRDEP